VSSPRFFTFRKPPDWQRGVSFHLETGRQGLSIKREQVYRLMRRQRLEHPLLTAPVVRSAVGLRGRWVLLDAEGMLWAADLLGNHVEAISESEDPDQLDRYRIAVTDDAVVVLRGGGSVLRSLTAEGGQIRWEIQDWFGEAFYGLAVAADAENGVNVLAAVGGAGDLQLIRFNAAGLPREPIALPLAVETNPELVLQDRFALAFGPDGDGWLIDREERRLFRVDGAAGLADPVPLPEEVAAETPVALCSGGDGTVWLLTRTGEGDFALARIGRDGALLERGYTGGARGGLLTAGPGAVSIWDREERCLYTLKPVLETAVWRAYGRRMGVWICDALDSGSPATEWHKIVLDATRADDTQITVRYYASDHTEAVLNGRKVELDRYLRDPDVPDETKLANLEALWSAPLREPEDALLFKAHGRYLWLCVELVGTEQHAPVVHSLEVHFPRLSLIESLPAIYQQHEPSRDFLTRYLSIFQTLLEETDRHIGRVTRTLDPGAASGSSLGWLLQWLGIKGEAYWTEEQLRALLKKAPTLYRLRGTKSAMEQLIEIYTGEKPLILEYDQVKPLKENPELGEVADRLYAADPYVFNVLVKAEHADTEMKRTALRHLIEAMKPVFASYKLIVLQPWVYMDLHSYLGMNTVLSEPTLLTLDGRSSMPHHTITIDLGQENRLDRHTRLGLDSRLE
jgi:phage tail-like protein